MVHYSIASKIIFQIPDVGYSINIFLLKSPIVILQNNLKKSTIVVLQKFIKNPSKIRLNAKNSLKILPNIA